jgi:hypothetical protein
LATPAESMAGSAKRAQLAVMPAAAGRLEPAAIQGWAVMPALVEAVVPETVRADPAAPEAQAEPEALAVRAVPEAQAALAGMAVRASAVRVALAAPAAMVATPEPAVRAA